MGLAQEAALPFKCWYVNNTWYMLFANFQEANRNTLFILVKNLLKS